MTKSEVEDERLGEWVIMPSGCEMSFMAWWKRLPNVRYPHSSHGNSGKVSHAAKKDAKSDFLTFVDINYSPMEEVLIAVRQLTFFFQNFVLCKHQRKA